MRELNIIENTPVKSLTYGVANSGYGRIFLALNENHIIIYTSFVFDDSKNFFLQLNDLKKLWPKALIVENNDLVAKIMNEIFDKQNTKPINIGLNGTPFQVKVWREIAKIKEGSTTTYQDIAAAIGNPKAVRAVGTAVGKNRLAYLVPCHRVITKNSGLGKFRWGSNQKKKLLMYENAIN